MEAKPAKLIEFFSGFKQSVIPLFQRPYEWVAREWDTLWRDVLEQYESETDVNHFMGAIVTMPAKSVPVGVSKYLVIDGQQRLTTIAILMCAIRDALPLDAKPRKRIQDHHLTNDGYEGWEYLKLLPTQSDREAFQALTLGRAPVPNSSVTAAYRHFCKKLTETDGNDDPIEVARILETVERRLMVVSINLGEADDPYLIFESLNFKGSPLTQADLVRNYFLMRFPVTGQQRVYDEVWQPMQQRMGKELTNFMLRYLMMTMGQIVRKSEIYAQLKRQLQDEPPQTVEESLRRMGRFSEYYQTFLDPQHEPHLASRRILDRLLRWEVETSHPMLLVLADRRRSGKLDDAAYLRCLQAVDSYVVRRGLCGISTNHLQKVFIDLAGKTPTSGVTEWLVQTLAEMTGVRRWPTDDEFYERWMRGRVYGYHSGRCKLLLAAIEEEYGHKEPADLENASIEHIMPQTLTDDWRQGLGAKAEEDWSVFADTIGNLTLTCYNSELSNAPFDSKKQIYADSHFQLNKYFQDVKRWNAKAIERRADRLWEVAKDIWWRPT